MATTDLGRIVPAGLLRKFKIAKFKLSLIVIVWLLVAGYSYLATFFGYQLANLGNLSFVLALASQIFTMIYAVPDVGEIRKRIFRVGTLPFWIVICFSAHLISFGGSAFYHYMKIMEVKGRGDFATPHQVNSLHDAQRKIRFNTTDYVQFLEGLRAYYDGKRKASISGRGVSGLRGRGYRAVLFENIVSEIESERDFAKKIVSVASAGRLTEPGISLAGFSTFAGMLSSDITHPESESPNLADAQDKKQALLKRKPAFDYGEFETVLSYNEGRQAIRSFIAEYPFVRVVIPFGDLASGLGRIKEINDIFSLKFLEEGGIKENYSVIGGLFAATIIEISMLIVNMFFIIQGTSLKAIHRRIDRSSIIDTAYDVGQTAITQFMPFPEKAENLDPKIFVTLLNISRKYVEVHLDIETKLFCTELSAKPERKRGTTGLLSRLWQQVGLGYEAIYYKLDENWLKATAENKSYFRNKANKNLIYRTGDDSEEWDFAVRTLARKLLDNLARSGEYIEVDGMHWIDFGDFNEWICLVSKKVGASGADFPSVLRTANKTSWEKLLMRTTTKNGEPTSTQS